MGSHDDHLHSTLPIQRPAQGPQHQVMILSNGQLYDGSFCVHDGSIGISIWICPPWAYLQLRQLVHSSVSHAPKIVLLLTSIIIRIQIQYHHPRDF
jgi:hypothetical protein